MVDEKGMILHSGKKAKARRNLKVKPAKTITIMADFGFGPYAWLKDASDQTDYVGLNIANRKTGMTEFHISKQLEADFGKWIDNFERHALDSSDFDWKAFHRDGLCIAKRLKQEVGNLANVLYVKPVEDPNHGVKEKTWIEEGIVPYSRLTSKKNIPSKKSLKFKSLIEKHTWEDIWPEFRKLYPDQKKSREGYKQVFSELRAIKPKATKMRIVVEEVPAERNQEGYVHVSGKNGTLRKAIHSKHFNDCGKNDPEESFAIEYTPWEEWLGMRIDQPSAERFFEVEIIVHCLWEMTFAGFDQASIKEQITELKRRVEEIKNMTEEERKEKLIPMEDVMKRVRPRRKKVTEKK
ncbi:MAG: hypothetical protein ACD_28C00081G0002 [uncultured bacterium]|nr:MAG: hypothetical protein ACD_28C00081G0002 [uncultured bacterium]